MIVGELVLSSTATWVVTCTLVPRACRETPHPPTDDCSQSWLPGHGATAGAEWGYCAHLFPHAHSHTHTPLLIAAELGYINMVQLLVQREASVEVLGTAATWVITCTPVSTCTHTHTQMHLCSPTTLVVQMLIVDLFNAKEERVTGTEVQSTWEERAYG